MTDDDLMEAEGDMDKLAGKIQQRTGDKRKTFASGWTTGSKTRTDFRNGLERS